MIYIWIYIACMVVMLAVLLGFKSQLKSWQKVLAVLFAPAMIVLLVIGAIVLIIDHICKHGFHDILPRQKSKAYPLDREDFRFWSKDTIMAGTEKMSIVDYNEKYGKSITLDDVYGQGYSESLTPEDLFNCKVFIPKKFGLEPNMPDYIYKTISIAFAKAFALGDISFIESYINEKTYLVLYKKDELSGKARVLSYFSDWIDKATNDNLKVKITVKWQPNQCRPAVYIKPDGYKEMVLLFYVCNDSLADIIFAPSLLQDYGCMFHDIDQPPYSVEFISNFIGEDEATQGNHLSCPTCGTDSNLIDWYKFHIPMGIHGYAGTVSICPDCKRVVELVPNIRLRYEEPQRAVFGKTHCDSLSKFTPRLLGLYTFETEDEQMDFYSEDELTDICRNNLNEYRQTGNLEKGNDAAIIYANGSFSDEAIELFTELSEKGCHNSMLNLFSIYWSNRGEYKKATEWLQYITGGDNPSIKCLWNLAVLYYFGENLPNNPLTKDHTKAKNILLHIKNIPMAGKSNDIMRVIANAIKFYPLVDKLNDFSLSGIEIHDIITNSIVQTKDIKDKGELFNCANALSLKSGYKLGLHIADENTPDIGDESYFFLYDCSGAEHKIHKSRINLEDVDTSLIEVAPTAMGAWQLYLLITSPTIMPVFWHGGYNVRKYIFSVDDLKSIEPIQNLDFTILNQDGLLLPVVNVAKDRKTADVYCTYWNDWHGLIREHVRIMFNPDGSASMGKPDQYTFYKYDCGICF